MIEVLATLAGLAFCFGVGLLFEVNHQAATKRGLAPIGVEGALASWHIRMSDSEYAALCEDTYNKPWNPTTTKGYTCPDMPVTTAEREVIEF